MAALTQFRNLSGLGLRAGLNPSAYQLKAAFTSFSGALSSKPSVFSEARLLDLRFNTTSVPKNKNKDVVVVGGGPGGYIAAIKAAQLGLKVACIESRGSLGGTCLNVGCIPSKTLLHYTHLLHESSQIMNKLYTASSLKSLGLKGATVDVAKLMKLKESSVRTLTRGIEGLFKKNGVEYVRGHGEITSNNSVRVDDSVYNASNIVVATGSEPISLPGIDIDEEKIVTSTGALSLKEVPKSMIVIGAGVIGLELGSVWSRLGSKVSFIEYAPQIGGYMDGDLSKLLRRSLEKQGLKFHCNEKVISAKINHNHGAANVNVMTESRKSGEVKKHAADVVLVAVGRKPYTKNLGLQNIGVKIDERGRVEVDDMYQTNVPSVYAIGDVIRGPMLAHKAEEEGVSVAEIIAGHHPNKLDFDNIPGVVYTTPEIAFVGITEEMAQKSGLDYTVGKFPISANSRARAIGEKDGIVKVITDNKNGKLLGMHIMCNNASEMIGEAVLARTQGLKTHAIGDSCHAHPTVSEAVKEASMASYGLPLNM